MPCPECGDDGELISMEDPLDGRDIRACTNCGYEEERP